MVEELMFPLPRVHFPDPRTAPDDVVAVGAAPTPELLLEAYSNGIFPWPQARQPLLWFCPDPRFVLPPREAHLHRSLKKTLKKTTLVIKADTAFGDVIAACAESSRPRQRGTWITRPMMHGYSELHEAGFAHSIEAWDGDVLVGGLYGVSIGSVFFGESMFTRVADASKIAFATLCAHLVRRGFDLIDSQSHTEHVERFGARHWPRDRFLDELPARMAKPTVRGPWTLAATPRDAATILDAPLPPDHNGADDDNTAAR